MQGPDRDRLVRQSERENAIVVGDCAQLTKGALGFRIPLIGIAHFGQGPNPHLGRQTEPLPHIAVAPLLQREPAKGALVPSDLADGVAGPISCH
jgi:hypothetical protein